MKTIEKAKRYDEAIEIARKIANGDPINVPNGTPIPLAIFPELAESEDDMIRKALIKYYSFDKDGGSHALDNITPKQIVAYLEKQCKQQSIWSKEDEYKLSILEAICDDQINSSASYSTMYREMHELKNWLKSLKPQNRWKPSEYELDAILVAIKDERQKGSDIVVKVLLNVYQQLKKLKEE